METIKISDNAMKVAKLELNASAHFLRHRGQATPSVYVPGTEAKMTRERAYAAMLEEDPEAYAAYRAQHNAKGVIDALGAAGIRLAR
jgi:hypothetical protein